MGQKVNPIGIRLGIVQDWKSKWYADKNYADVLWSDIQVRQYLESELQQAQVSSIIIERPANNAIIRANVARPGVVIGKKGGLVEKIRAKASKMLGVPVHLTVEEVRKPELDARLVAENVADQLKRRVMFRRAMKRAVTTAMRAGADGIKICVGGRLGGAEIARTEWYREGRVPLHTFRADIDYALAEAKTPYGIIGVKVWICRGEILSTEAKETKEAKSVSQKLEDKKQKTETQV